MIDKAKEEGKKEGDAPVYFLDYYVASYDGTL